MQQIEPQCTNCGLFTRRSLHHEEEYQSSVLFERLRTSNTPATDAEISHIRHTILSAISGDISSIDTKIASLHEVIRSMEEERGRLINVQKNYNNLVSLHRTLPLEIWSKIFLSTITKASDSNALDASGSIWRLSHVCQRWRSIALSFQSFWSTMTLRFPQDAQLEEDVQRLEVVIQRSSPGLLNVTLSDSGIRSDLRYVNSNPSILRRMLDIMLAETHRWREFQLTNFHGNLSTTMPYASLHHRLPLLESVVLHLDPLEEHTAVSVFKDCPRLTRLALGVRTLGFEFPWDQITELDLSYYLAFDSDEEERREAMRLIGQCPSLEVLTTPGWYLDEDDDGSASTPITFSCMSKLNASSVNAIDGLTLPRLREASLNHDPNYLRPHMLYAFKRLLMRSGCIAALTRLSLTSVPLATSSEHSLVSILTQTCSLTFLDLAVSMHWESDDGTDQEQIVAILNSLKVIPTETVTFLPLLSSLGIRIYNHRDAMRLRHFRLAGSLASMVKARWKGDHAVGLARLRTCHLHVEARSVSLALRSDGELTSDVFTEAENLILNALVEDGMDLWIQITSKSVGDDKVVCAVGG